MAKRAKKTTRKMSPTHLANLRAAHAKRRGKKRGRPKGSKNKIIAGLHEAIALRLPEYIPTERIKELTLVERFKSTIDALEIQLKRLSNF